jgi:hypothetical protein
MNRASDDAEHHDEVGHHRLAGQNGAHEPGRSSENPRYQPARPRIRDQSHSAERIDQSISEDIKTYGSSAANSRLNAAPQAR